MAEAEIIDEKYAWDRGTQWEDNIKGTKVISQLSVSFLSNRDVSDVKLAIVGRMNDVSNVFEDELLEKISIKSK